jgi:hypothetical protein
MDFKAPCSGSNTVAKLHSKFLIENRKERKFRSRKHKAHSSPPISCNVDKTFVVERTAAPVCHRLHNTSRLIKALFVHFAIRLLRAD